MASFSNKAMRQLSREIGHDLDQYQQRLFQNLVRETPIDTGAAQKSWKNVKDMSSLVNTGRNAIVIRNDIPYIQRLDEGHSSQQPRPFVKRTIDNTRR